MNIHRIVHRFLKKELSLNGVGGFSQATYDLHGVQIDVNAQLSSIHNQVKHQLMQGHSVIAGLNFSSSSSFAGVISNQ